MVHKCSLMLLIMALTVCFRVAPANAQTSTGGNVGLSYSFLRLLDEDDLNMPAGWLVSFAQPIGGSPVSIVGEAAGNYKTEFDETLRLHTFQGGVRVAARTNPNVTPFAQFLAGVMNINCGCGESKNYFAIEPGGGVDFRVSDRVAFRVGASFPMAFNEGETGNSFRFQTGVVLPLGGR
jgi:hypothetical protein